MGKLGFVSDVRTVDGRTFITIIQTDEDIREKPLKLGQLIKIQAQQGNNTVLYLGMVCRAEYRPVIYDKHLEALALSHINDSRLDNHAVKNINFLHFDAVILGRYEKAECYSFYPSTRLVPSLTDVQAEDLESNELQSLINVSVQPDSTDLSNSSSFTLGYLRLGSAPEDQMENVFKLIDIENFRSRRTANFGKTGFGKSNENKVLLTLLRNKYPNMGILIFDLNGEYASQTAGTTAEGLIEVFHKLNIRSKNEHQNRTERKEIVWFTNRKQLPDMGEIYTTKPIKINFFEEPWLAIELAYQRARLDGQTIPQYLENAREGLHPDSGDWKRIPNKMAYVYGAFLQVGMVPDNQRKAILDGKEYILEKHKNDFLDALRKGSERSDGSEGARKLFQYAGRLSFLKDLHSPDASEDFFDSALEALKNGKIVIIDLPTVRAEIADFVSVRLASRVFSEALKSYTEKQKPIDMLLVIEEAHNLLSDEQGKQGGIFYRIAREGRKYGLGMLYSTQSPNGISMDILSQTENFLVKHVSSEEDVRALKRAKVAFAEPISDFILNEPIVGLSYVYMEPYQPFPVPVKVRLLNEVVDELLKESHT